jgi:hypothetical protein
MNVIIIRGNVRHMVPLGQVRSTDLVLTNAGRFIPASSISGLRPSFPPQSHLQNKAGGNDGGGLGKLLFVGILGWLVVKALEPRPMRRRKRRPRNDAPLSAALRAYIRERDGAFCTYCGSYAPYGHVDHRVSRATGGSNRVNNLSWSCAPCNQSKGAMNARQFARRL